MILCKKGGKDTYFDYKILIWIVHSLATQDAFGHEVIKNTTVCNQNIIAK